MLGFISAVTAASSAIAELAVLARIWLENQEERQLVKEIDDHDIEIFHLATSSDNAVDIVRLKIVTAQRSRKLKQLDAIRSNKRAPKA